MKKRNVLFNPQTFTGDEYDEKTRKVFLDTIRFFEEKGLKEMRDDEKYYIWQADWMRYQKEHGIFATILTAKGYGDDPDARYDLYRICTMNEILGFYGTAYQYPMQVSILGVGPIWMGDNEEQKKELAQQLKEGNVFAFGMSEKEHGADLYANEINLTETGKGTYVANGSKYYIGNAQIASKISCMGKNKTTGEYTNWVVDSRHRNYKYIKDVDCPSLGQARVGEFDLIEYPITDRDILKTGDEAFADGLSSVNIGKFQIGYDSTGMVTHAFYEAITHSNRRILYGKPVTEFPHIRAFLSEAFCRINAMKLYSLRSRDYFRKMSDEDRRYLLFNPIQKMKVAREGGVVTNLLMDVVCAKGYERENFLSDVHVNIDMEFRLEGTAHVNMALVLKFINKYFFNNVEYPEFGIVSEMKNDDNIFRQKMGGLAKVPFADYGKAYKGVDLPNVKRFFELVEKFRELYETDAPDEALRKNMDHMLNYGEIFTELVYAQLVLEGAKLNNVEDDLIDQMFALFIRDVNKFALTQVNEQINTETQRKLLTEIALHGPVVDKERDYRFWKEYVQVLDGAYVAKDSPIGAK